MKDFSFWNEYEGAAEGSGRSEKVWLINPDTQQIGLFKYKKDMLTTDHISESISYKMADLLGIPCAKFEIGMYKGQEGSMSYNIIEHESMSLIEGIYFINVAYPAYDAEKFMDMKSGSRYSLEMIRHALEPYHLFNDFLSIPLFDYLIGNTDRHQSNWALILENGKYHLSPLYDNSSSLCAYISESRWDEYLGNDKLLWKSLIDTKSKSLIRILCNEPKKCTHLDMMKYLRTYYYDNTWILAEKMINRITEKQIRVILDEYEEDSLPYKKRDIITKFLCS